MIKRIERLEILGLLACGGQAQVYLARSVSAVLIIKKHFRPEDFLREFCALASLSHRNITRLKALYSHEKNSSLVLEYGGSYDLRLYLNQLKRQPKPASLCVIYYIASALCEALAYLHKCEIYHNDLSPSNILIDSSGDIRIIDFGAASRAGSTKQAIIFGKKQYMAPELLAGELGHGGSDIYALGHILVELVIGQLWDHVKPKASIALLSARLEGSKPEFFSWLLSSVALDPELRPKYFFDFSSQSELESEKQAQAPAELLALLRLLPGRAISKIA